MHSWKGRTILTGNFYCWWWTFYSCSWWVSLLVMSRLHPGKSTCWTQKRRFGRWLFFLIRWLFGYCWCALEDTSMMGHTVDGDSLLLQLMGIFSVDLHPWSLTGEPDHQVLEKEIPFERSSTLNWLVVSTPLKNISQTGNLPQIGV